MIRHQPPSEREICRPCGKMTGKMAQVQLDMAVTCPDLSLTALELNENEKPRCDACDI